MIKYKVKDAAADFSVPNKQITEILKTHCGVDKKTMTTLAENELDVLFDVLTKENQVESFDAYFAVRNQKLEQEEAPVKEEPKNAEKPAVKKGSDKPAEKKDGKPAASNKPAPQKDQKDQKDQQKGNTPNHSRKRKVIDTRATNVNVERYNSKYDDLASGTYQVAQHRPRSHHQKTKIPQPLSEAKRQAAGQA